MKTKDPFVPILQSDLAKLTAVCEIAIEIEGTSIGAHGVIDDAWVIDGETMAQLRDAVRSLKGTAA